MSSNLVHFEKMNFAKINCFSKSKEFLGGFYGTLISIATTHQRFFFVVYYEILCRFLTSTKKNLKFSKIRKKQNHLIFPYF